MPTRDRVCVAHVIFYGAPVSDFHEDAARGLMIDLVAEDGCCIGEFLASVFAFLGSSFLIREATTKGSEECKAHFLASSDNAVVTGEVKHVIMRLNDPNVEIPVRPKKVMRNRALHRIRHAGMLYATTSDTDAHQTNYMFDVT